MTEPAPHFFPEKGGFNLPEVEDKVLSSWKTNNVFEKSLRRGKKRFVFFEGPPTANGRPGIHHVLARSFKDIILRYKTMRGFFVPRKGGWDTHGLPVELEVEKQLGLKSKKDIEAYGIAEFNKKCKESVWKYKDEWERLTDRMGFWIDLKNAYITYEPNYIETLWQIIKEVWKRGLLYQGHKVVPWCSRCGTALSSHEMAQGYKEVRDDSVFVKFKIKPNNVRRGVVQIGNHEFSNISVVSWTTTPWTLPGNVALAVGKSIKYVVRHTGAEAFIIAEASPLNQNFVGNVDEVVYGEDLVGLEYESLFKIPSLHNDKAYKIYAADFVTTTDGTGVVHTAVMYGEDDYQLGVKIGLPQKHTVDEQGRFTKEVPDLSGMRVKDKETEEKIFEHLKKNGNLLRTESYLHEYPHCWRCSTPLLYYARTSWFIAMSKLKKELLKRNEEINWIPAHLKEGRFGEWLKDIKDWNFSRERYWGTPLPIWECEKCDAREVLGSFREFHERMGGARNEYWVLRHGEAESYVKSIIDSGQGEYHLTTIGRDQVRRSAEKLKRKNIDLIFASDVLRTKETAEIAASVLGVSKITFEKRLREIHLGKLSGCHASEYHKRFPTLESRFETRPEDGESLRDLRQRLFEFIESVEKKYAGKKILLVSHEYPIWMLFHTAEAWSEREAIRARGTDKNGEFIELAGLRPLSYLNIPRNETGEVDIHRPYVDSFTAACSCGGTMRRVKELADVWFDSGSMPFASQKIPGVQSKIQYPADYIVEAMDQTRGWFYTLLAVATLLKKKEPYKNVISLGLVHDKTGQKMSKSRGNIVDPWMMAEKYGIDAVRWYFYTANPPGEPKNFDEQEIAKAFRRFHLILYNSFIFYRTYAKENAKQTKSLHVLDSWALMRLSETITEVSKRLDAYEIREAALSLETFVDDLSRWYIRRSRRRLQRPSDKKDYEAVSWTLGHVLRETAKLIAPFTPFFAEALHRGLTREQSVHLEDWPKRDRGHVTGDTQLLEGMVEVRAIASAGLAKRAELGIKVRQPLRELKIRSTPSSRVQAEGKSEIRNSKELLMIIADEVNVKSVVFDPGISEDIELDTVITPELKEEGTLRELTRMVQELRQNAGYEAKNKIILMAEVPAVTRGILEHNEKFLKEEVNAKEIEFRQSEKFEAEIRTKLDGEDVWLAVRKI